jgi:DNA-binding NtrC family response regulator
MVAILIGAKTKFVRQLLLQIVALEEACITTVQSGSQVLTTVTENAVDLVVIDTALTTRKDTDLVTLVRHTDPSVGIVLVRTTTAATSDRHEPSGTRKEVVVMPFQDDGLQSACRAALET